MPHLSHRTTRLGKPEKLGLEAAVGPALHFEHPSLAALAVLMVLCDEDESVLLVGDAGAALEKLGPLVRVKASRVGKGDTEALWTAIGASTRAVVVAAAELDDELSALVDETDAVLVVDGETAPRADALVLAGAAVNVGEALPLELVRRLACAERASRAAS